jgi:SAM-dependent methyltransferase
LRVITLVQCPVCGADRLRRVGFHYHYQGHDFPAAQCEGCGVRFLQARPDDESLAALYAGGYFERDYRCGHAGADYFASEQAYRAEDEGLLEDFARHVPVGRLLEVGCAGGWLLKHARERGWQVAGVEVSPEAVRHARSLGLEVAQGDLARAGLPGESFDLVYMGDVLEHVPDCRRTLVEVARVLRHGGVLYLRGPITTHSLARRLALTAAGATGRSLRVEGPPYHLWEFTPSSLRMLLELTGFQPVEMRQSKVPASLDRPGKTGLQRAAMFALDTVNRPLTRALNVLGDRITVVARRGAKSVPAGQVARAAAEAHLQLSTAEPRLRGK